MPPKESANDAGLKLATLAVRLITFVVPAVAGFVTALAVLRAVRPFDETSDQLTWMGVAVLASVTVSVLIGIWLNRALPRTRLFHRASNFESEVESRFRVDLREGNIKRLLRSGQIDNANEEQAKYVLDILRRLNHHEQLTRGHSERVRAYSTMIGREMDLTDDEIDVLKWSALLHDVGKLDVAGSILSSEEAPTKAQWAVLKRHPVFARRYLEPLVPWLGDDLRDGAVHHHERWDGKGYPDQLRGDDIPVFGRIIAVADSFDVMTHNRSYKNSEPIDEARRELAACSGSQFDPEVVDALLRIGEAELKAVRGWSATVAGLSVAIESNLIAVGTQAVTVATLIASAVIIGNEPVSEGPDALAFDSPTTTAVVATTTIAPTTIAPTTTTAPASTTTSTSTLTTTTIATTTEAPSDLELRSLNYRIGSVIQDGILSTVAADRLDVFINDVPNQSLNVAAGQRLVTVLLDITDLSPGLHIVRFDLYNGTKLVSSEVAPVER